MGRKKKVLPTVPTVSADVQEETSSNFEQEHLAELKKVRDFLFKYDIDTRGKLETIISNLERTL